MSRIACDNFIFIGKIRPEKTESVFPGLCFVVLYGILQKFRLSCKIRVFSSEALFSPPFQPASCLFGPPNSEKSAILSIHLPVFAIGTTPDLFHAAVVPPEDLDIALFQIFGGN
nr:hypothetical protein [uncultured Oscillibacter sp.]